MLGNFNRTVLLVACVLLIIGLVIIGLFSVKSIQDSAYPPIISDCPDYWNVTYNRAGEIICRNNQINDGYATTQCRNYPTSKFNVSGTSANDIICEKSKWAKDCNIHWDGITNNPKACTKTTM